MDVGMAVILGVVVAGPLVVRGFGGGDGEFGTDETGTACRDRTGKGNGVGRKIAKSSERAQAGMPAPQERDGKARREQNGKERQEGHDVSCPYGKRRRKKSRPPDRVGINSGRPLQGNAKARATAGEGWVHDFFRCDFFVKNKTEDV
jgi:hypothetical protein